MSLRDFVIVGLTGATGSGKSTVSGFFKENGFVIIDADKIA
ncbi:MAG: dephospho-CoA kinase [Clostridia bacterium]|nr:dephospho-CoA kinase [Clostridia bacterium]